MLDLLPIPLRRALNFRFVAFMTAEGAVGRGRVSVAYGFVEYRELTGK